MLIDHGRDDLAINLVGADMNDALRASLAAGLHQAMCSHNIGTGKFKGITERIIDMALSRRMDDQIRVLDGPHARIQITDITDKQLNTFFLYQSQKIADICCISHFIKHGYG